MGTTEVIIFAALILFFFGGKRLPDFVRSLGKSVEEFKKALQDKEDSKK